MDIVQHGEEAYASGEGAILVSAESAHEAAAGAAPDPPPHRGSARTERAPTRPAHEDGLTRAR